MKVNCLMFLKRKISRTLQRVNKNIVPTKKIQIKFKYKNKFND